MYRPAFIYLLEQFVPSPVKPGLQVQKKLPIVLVQKALGSQLWSPVEHSSISERTANITVKSIPLQSSVCECIQSITRHILLNVTHRCVLTSEKKQKVQKLFYSPLQPSPSSARLNPGSQLQTKDPIVFVQLWLQPPLLVAHSLISATRM